METFIKNKSSHEGKRPLINLGVDDKVIKILLIQIERKDENWSQEAHNIGTSSGFL